MAYGNQVMPLYTGLSTFYCLANFDDFFLVLQQDPRFDRPQHWAICIFDHLVCGSIRVHKTSGLKCRLIN